MGKGEPQKTKGNAGVKDMTNLIGVRTAARGSSLEVQFDKASYGSNDTEQKVHEDYMYGDAAVQHIMKLTGLDEEEAEKTRDAIGSWSGSSYSDIREVQQGKSKSEYYRVMGNRLERFIDRAPKWAGKMTYRGIKMKAEDIGKFRVGDTVDMKGTSSWSSTFYVAESFSHHQVVFASTTQKHGTSIKFHSGFSSENEVVVSKKSRYRIKRISQMKSGTTVVWLDEQ